MLRKYLMPLRTITGNALPIGQLTVSGRAPEAQSLTVAAIIRNNLNEIVADPQYATYFPTVFDGVQTAGPAGGMASFPIPPDMPFPADVRFGSFFGFGLPVDDTSGTVNDISRKLWVEVDILLEARAPRLVGGILLCGFPYLPYDLTDQGEITSNFGLPREIRVSWSAAFGSGFLDDESSLTDQSIASHGGLHILPTGPIMTDRLRLRLADFPRFLSRLDTTSSPPRRLQFWGFVIPLFYVFEHAERTRYRPSVPGGMLAAVTLKGDQRPGAGLEASLTTSGGPSHYVTFTAASLFRPRRSFQVAPGAAPLSERFVSRRLAPGEEARIYFEQCEEYERCLAGLRLRFSELPGPDPAAVNPPLRVSVYELDPLEGESPLLIELGGKYASLLFSGDIDAQPDGGVMTFPLRFVRPSSVRCFALVMKNKSESDGVLMMRSIELVQSADVVVAPRQSRSQTIRNLHMRLIGPGLAEDHCRVGPETFTLSVERLVAGAKKDVLFCAESLLDLLQTGAARLYANQRRRAAEAEVVTLDNRNGQASFEERRSRAGSTGWRRSESGEQVGDFVANNLSVDFQNWRDEQNPFSPSTNNLSYGFSVFGNQESRLHTELLFPRSADGNEWQSAATWINGLVQATDLGALLGNQKLIPDSPSNRLIARNWQRRNGLPNHVWEVAAWRGLDVPDVLGVKNVTISPFSPIASLGQLLADLRPLARDAVRLLRGFADGSNLDITALQASIDSLNAFTDLLRSVYSGPFVFLNASGLGVSISPVGLGFSISAPSSFPSIICSTAVGSTGSISMQAFNTGYSYSQFLSSGFDEGISRTDFLASTMRRIVTRAEVSDEDTRRIRGAEVMWQGQLVDILTLSIPLNFTLPAIAGRTFRTSDDSLRVRFGNSVRRSVAVDVWLDIDEEVVPHDY